MNRILIFCAFTVAISSATSAQGVFEGTWRPEYPQKVSPSAKHDVITLKDGEYTCRSCQPPYTVKADGLDHPLRDDPDYDTRSALIIDARTVTRTAKKGGVLVVTSKSTVSEDGSMLTELQTQYADTAHPVVVRLRSRRVGPVIADAHAVSGEWQRLDYDLPNNDEDTTFHVSGNVLSMSDKLGRSFTARLDGADAPYSGSPQFTSVSVRLLDSRTIEERDKSHGRVVKITRWTVDPDGTTIHARFDDTHGRIQEQAGRKLP